MRIPVAFIIFQFVMTSCASLLNGPTSSILVASDRPAELMVKGKQYTIDSMGMISVERKHEPLTLRARADSLEKVIYLFPQNSPVYYANFFTWGIGFFIDARNDKRFAYPHKVYFDFRDTTRFLTLGAAPRKGDLNLVVSFPWVNQFHLQPQNEELKINTGFVGLSGGVEYYYRTHRFLSFTVAAATDFLVPFPAAVDFRGEYEQMSTLYWSLTHQHQWRRLTLGYGVHYAMNRWSLKYSFDADHPPQRAPITRRDLTLGINLDAYWQLGQNFSVGVIYRPSFWRVAPAPANLYQHLISLDLAWKVKLVNCSRSR